MVTATMTVTAVVETANGVALGLANGHVSNGIANGVVKPAPAPAPERMYVTYDGVHKSIISSVELLRQAGWDAPDYLIAISGGERCPAAVSPRTPDASLQRCLKWWHTSGLPGSSVWYSAAS